MRLPVDTSVIALRLGRSVRARHRLRHQAAQKIDPNGVAVNQVHLFVVGRRRDP